MAERRTADDSSLREARRDCMQAFSGTTTAVMLIIDPEDGRIVDANRAAVRFYGYTARKLKTLSISDINMLDAGEVRMKVIQAAKEEHRHFIFQHHLADGTIRDVEVSSGPILLKGRKLLIPSSTTSRSASGPRRPFATALRRQAPCSMPPRSRLSSSTRRARSSLPTRPLPCVSARASMRSSAHNLPVSGPRPGGAPQGTGGGSHTKGSTSAVQR